MFNYHEEVSKHPIPFCACKVICVILCIFSYELYQSWLYQAVQFIDYVRNHVNHVVMAQNINNSRSFYDLYITHIMVLFKLNVCSVMWTVVLTLRNIDYISTVTVY